MSKRSRARRRLFAAAAMLLGVSFAWLVTEVTLRIYVAARGWTPNCYVTGLAFFVPDPAAGYRLRPNLRVRSSTYDITTNSLGLRGPEISRRKPAGVTRLAVVGGSAVFGYLTDDAHEPCRMLEQRLLDRGWKVQVINGGVPGYNITQCRKHFETVIAPLGPDVVLVYSGWNDLKALISPHRLPPQERCPPAPPWWQRALARSVVYGLVRYRLFPPRRPRFAPPPDTKATVTTVGAEMFRREYRAMLTSIQRAGAIPVASTQLTAACPNCEHTDRFLGADRAQVESTRRIGSWINDAIRDLARQTSTPLVEVCGRADCNPTTLGDAIHPTADGYQQITKLWCEALEPILAERLQPGTRASDEGNEAP